MIGVISFLNDENCETLAECVFVDEVKIDSEHYTIRCLVRIEDDVVMQVKPFTSIEGITNGALTKDEAAKVMENVKLAIRQKDVIDFKRFGEEILDYRTQREDA